MAVYLTTTIGDQYQLDKENCTNSSLNSIVGSGSVVVGSVKIVYVLDKFAISIYISIYLTTLIGDDPLLVC